MMPETAAQRGLPFLLLCLFSSAPGRAVNVLTVNYNNSRTNANLNETILNTSNVNVRQFGKIFSVPVNGWLSGQPLYMQSVSIPGKGEHNVVFVATMHNDVYAFDADAPGFSLWHVNLGPSVPGVDYLLFDTPEVGILSTPVIDPGTNTLYLVANTKENGTYYYRLHALEVTTGQEKFGGPAVIQATFPGTSPFDSQNGTMVFDAFQHLQRPGLLLVNNTIYMGFGAHADNGVFHGWFLGYDAANVQRQVRVFLTSPDGYGASIWQAGHGPAADDQGNIYVMTGNGTWDGVANWGQSFLKLDTSNGMRVADWFTPDNWAHLNDDDLDLGSCGPVLIGSGRVLSGGKEGRLYLLDGSNMGHLQSGNNQILQSFPAIGYAIFSIAYWDNPDGPVVYLRGYNDVVKAFRMSGGRLGTTPFSKGARAAGLPLDGMAVSANGSPDSAILWLTTTDNPNTFGEGTLRAYAAADVSRELWNSDMNPVRDPLGNLAKYASPTVANGKVYVPTFSDQLVVYGLQTSVRAIAAVVNAASGATGPIAPGELVIIYGRAIGPVALAGAVLDGSGRLSTSIAGARILFNGLAAPLIYVRSDQVAAVVPYFVAGRSTVSVQAEYLGQRTLSVTLGVADTAPGLFTMNESGQGQGAILNQDGSLNSPGNPAGRGSIAVLYGTGQGQTNPTWREAELATAPYPAPLAPVSVNIGGQPAEILYAGAAPGFAGLMQVNARVPAGIPPDPATPVTLTIGANSSQSAVTLAVE